MPPSKRIPRPAAPLFVAGLAALLQACGAVQPPSAATSNVQAATFSHANFTTTCIACHLADRPTYLVSSYVHSYAVHGDDDCVECHTQPGITWAGAYHQHDPIVGIQCATCHVADRPKVANYPDGTMVQGHFEGQDCVNCHLPQLTRTPIPFTYTHVNVFGNMTKTCLPCHLQQGVEAHGPSIGDCVSCHTPTGDWKDGKTNPSDSPSPSPSDAPSPGPSNTPSR